MARARPTATATEGFEDLDTFFDPNLRLPIGGKVYVIPPADAEVGIWCTALYAQVVDASAGREGGADLVLDDEEEVDMYARCLGPAFAAMRADNVGWPKIQLAGVTAFFWIAAGKDMASRYWRGGGVIDPKSLAPNRASRRSTRSTGAANTTKPRASTSGTRRSLPAS